MLLEIFYLIYSSSFHLFRFAFKVKLLTLMTTQYLMKNTILLVSYTRNLGLPSRVAINFSMFSSRSFMALEFTFKFELLFVYGIRYGLKFDFGGI